MSQERWSFRPAESLDPQPEAVKDTAEVLDSEGFDLDAFFGITVAGKEQTEELTLAPAALDLLVTLRDDSNESITTLTKNITAESFAAGASLSSSVFSALAQVVGSCGVLCAHSLGALGQAGSGLSGASGLAGGLSMPGLSIDEHGHVHMDGNVNQLSRATGIAHGDLLAGKFSVEDILHGFLSVLGEGMSLVFGLGLVEGLMGCLFDSFLPTTEP